MYRVGVLNSGQRINWFYNDMLVLCVKSKNVH